MAAGPSATANATGSAIDPKLFYGYLFEADKKPTRTLDALLRGIAGYIVSLLCDRRYDGRRWDEGGRLTGVTERAYR